MKYLCNFKKSMIYQLLLITCFYGLIIQLFLILSSTTIPNIFPITILIVIPNIMFFEVIDISVFLVSFKNIFSSKVSFSIE